ncbi:MAG: SDR family NAD(P)-dependent oxidoreductase, partial [Desulfofustis sp.]
MTNSTELRGRVAVIPGAGRPLGRAIAELFGSRGASLVVPIIDDWPHSNNEMKAEFELAGYDFLLVPCDLRDPIQTKKLVDEIDARYGAMHYLINNIERGGMPVV